MNEPHWAVIRILEWAECAQGYCWCDNPENGPHRIGLKPQAVGPADE